MERALSMGGTSGRRRSSFLTNGAKAKADGTKDAGTQSRFKKADVHYEATDGFSMAIKQCVWEDPARMLMETGRGTSSDYLLTVGAVDANASISFSASIGAVPSTPKSRGRGGASVPSTPKSTQPGGADDQFGEGDSQRTPESQPANEGESKGKGKRKEKGAPRVHHQPPRVRELLERNARSGSVLGQSEVKELVEAKRHVDPGTWKKWLVEAREVPPTYSLLVG